MACNPLEAFTKECGAYVKNGINSIYVVAFSGLLPVSGSTEVYATSVNGIVNSINLSGGTKFVKVDVTKKTGGIKETVEVADNGSVNITNEFNISIDSFSANNRKFTKSLIGVPVVILNKLKSGKWCAIGLDGNFEFKSSELNIDDTNNARTLVFSGEASDLIPEVDATIVPALIA